MKLKPNVQKILELLAIINFIMIVSVDDFTSLLFIPIYFGMIAVEIGIISVLDRYGR